MNLSYGGKFETQREIINVVKLCVTMEFLINLFISIFRVHLENEEHLVRLDHQELR